MFAIYLDRSGEYDLTMPDDNDGLIQLAESYVKLESELEAAQRVASPPLELVQKDLEAARNARESASSGEIKRAGSSQDFDRSVEEGMARGSLAINRLKGLNAHNVANLEAWGVSTKKGANGRVTVKKPRTAKEWVLFLEAYVRKEESQPAESRVADPPLDEMKQLAKDVRQHFDARGSGYSQRVIGNSALSSTLQPLREKLQLAAHTLVVLCYGGKIGQDLRKWGFPVTARVTPPEEKPAATEVPASG